MAVQRRAESKRNGGGSDHDREYGGNGGEGVRPDGGAHCECFGQAGQAGWGPGKISHLAVEGGIELTRFDIQISKRRIILFYFQNPTSGSKVSFYLHFY